MKSEYHRYVGFTFGLDFSIRWPQRGRNAKREIRHANFIRGRGENSVTEGRQDNRGTLEHAVDIIPVSCVTLSGNVHVIVMMSARLECFVECFMGNCTPQY